MRDQKTLAPDRNRTRIRPTTLWFGVLGGVTAWLVHLTVAWGVLELSCISPADGPWVDNRGGSPGTAAWTAVLIGTVAPWLIAAAALVTCLLLHLRRRRLAADEALDVLADERVGFLLVLGALLDVFALLAITGGIVGMLTLEACG